MITLTTDCDKCVHKGVCKYEGNAKSDMNKLKNTMYGKGPNDDYDWDIISNSRNVDIKFSCKDYREKTYTGIR